MASKKSAATYVVAAQGKKSIAQEELWTPVRGAVFVAVGLLSELAFFLVAVGVL